MFLWLIISVIGVFLLLCGALYLFQKKLVFYPMREFTMTPDQIDLPYEDVYINVTPNEKVHGWFFTANNPDSNMQPPVVLFCHGNAGNISHRLETADFILSLGADILLFDYRGYGQSDGSPSEANVYSDAEACYNWLLEQKGVKPEDIVLFGRSLGGAVVIELAQRVTCRGLIIESSFTSAEEMGKRIFPFLPTKYLLRYEFDSIGKIGSVTCPVLVTHSPDDEIVPFDMGKKLFASANEPRRFVPLRGGHNEREYLADSVYSQAVSEFIHNRRVALE
jgi:fermentation-respiration switch protein FrsA (DUF1100 family)